MNRAQLFDDLSHLSPQDFERRLVSVNMPRMHRAGAAAKIGEQVSALLKSAESAMLMMSNLTPGAKARSHFSKASAKM